MYDVLNVTKSQNKMLREKLGSKRDIKKNRRMAK
jgi:hypothetical protein